MLPSIGRRPLTILAIALLATAGRSAGAAAFNVYYRPDASSAWVFYSGAATRAEASRVVADLEAIGYLSRATDGDPPAVTGATPAAAPAAGPIVPGPSPITAGTYQPPSFYGVAGGSYTNTYGGDGSWWSSHTWHHHDARNDEHHDRRNDRQAHHDEHHDRHDVRPHPTNHPANRHPHPAAHGGHRGGHAGHHGGHHQHSHSHGHHGRR